MRREWMKDIENRLLEKYWVDVNRVRRVRNGYLCDTKQGLFRIKELSSSSKKIPYVQYVSQQLLEAGFSYVDIMLRNKEGDYVCDMRDQGQYVLKHWYMGRECDIQRENEILESCEKLAQLHNHLDVVSKQILLMQQDLKEDERWEEFVATDLITEWKRHNLGLKKTRSFVRRRVGKGEFESLFLQRFEEFYGVAEQVIQELENSQYNALYQQAKEQKSMAHGDYNHHNILLVGPNIAVTNFERFRVDVPISDLYYFMRKVMEKNNWDEKLGYKMLEHYGRKRTISDDEYQYMALRFSYPEKVWKLTNYYYNTNKAWISEKNVEKLKLLIEQMPIKKAFVKDIFTFHL